MLKVKERVEKELRLEKKKFDTNNEDQITIIGDFLLVSDKDVLLRSLHCILLKFNFILLKIIYIYIYILNHFNVLILKIIFKNNKKIILMHFSIKNTLKIIAIIFLNRFHSDTSNHATYWRKLFIFYTLGDYGHVRIRNMFFF